MVDGCVVCVALGIRVVPSKRLDGRTSDPRRLAEALNRVYVNG